MADLSAKAQSILDDLPVYAQEDRIIQAIVQAAAAEIERIEQFLAFLRVTLTPIESDDTYNILSYWESFVGLPVDPLGASDAQRRKMVIAAVQKRNAEAGTGWLALLDTILDGAPWTHTENTNNAGAYAKYQLAISNVGVSTTDYRYGIFQQTLRQTTPAHLSIDDIAVVPDSTFQVGISKVGDTI